MCEELSYQIINISAINQAVFCKNHCRKENISVGGSKQQIDALFKTHLRET